MTPNISTNSASVDQMSNIGGAGGGSDPNNESDFVNRVRTIFLFTLLLIRRIS